MITEQVKEVLKIEAQAILDLRLHQLTGLEQDKILDEYQELLARIDELLEILNDPDRLMQVIREELEQVREEFGDQRRTEISIDHEDLSLEDLIAEEMMAVTVTHAGYVKRLPLTSYRKQGRGGKGVTGMGMKEGDFIEHLFLGEAPQILEEMLGELGEGVGGVLEAGERGDGHGFSCVTWGDGWPRA